jgi:DNA adenine methylase
MKPFFKWSGGKRREAPVVRRFKPSQFDTFYEPFLGGGAIWLDLEHDKNVVNDSYADVMNFYRVLKSDTHRFVKAINDLSSAYSKEMESVKRDSAVEKQLKSAQAQEQKLYISSYKKAAAGIGTLNKKEYNEEKVGQLIEECAEWNEALAAKKAEIKKLKKELNKPVYEIADKYYYYYRNNDFDTDFENAVKFYILRQLSFSGMLRFSSDGKFNIPYGWYKSFKGIEQGVEEIQGMLNNTTLMCCDWKESVEGATKDDFVFLDPPYTRTFTEYHPTGQFGKEEHEALAAWFETTDVPVMIILNRDEFTESLYEDYIIGDYDYKYSIQYRDRMTEQDSNAKHFIAINNYTVNTGDEKDES